MNISIGAVWVSLVLILPACIWAQTPSPTPIQTETASASAYPRRHLYVARSVWGELRIRIVERAGKFDLQVDGDVPMDEWYLTSPDGVVTVAKGTASQGFQVKASIPVDYLEGFQLRVMVHSEGEPKPVSVRLSAGNAPTGKSSRAQDAAWLFVEDPGRPYNKLVRDFYQNALVHRQKGEVKEALKDLDQARKLDASHPQVAALRENLTGEASEAEAAERVKDARKQMEKGNFEIALERVGLILSEYPGCRPALSLQGEIEARLKGKKTPRYVKKRRRAKSEPVVAHSVPEQESGMRMEDRKALADKAYNLGIESYRRGNWVEARKFWEEVLRYVPGHSQARRNLDRLQTEHPAVK